MSMICHLTLSLLDFRLSSASWRSRERCKPPDKMDATSSVYRLYTDCRAPKSVAAMCPEVKLDLLPRHWGRR